MRLSSTAFKAGETIPARHTCEGENLSPSLAWDAIPDGTKSLALVLDDPDAPADEPFAHWVLYNISVERSGLPEGFRPGADWEGERGRNSFGNPRYEGPCPPFEEAHRYFFRLYAVDCTLSLGEGATRAQLMDALHGHIVSETELSGTYRRTGVEILS